MSSSPWGKIDNVTKVTRGISMVTTPRHGGFRVSLKALQEYSIDTAYLLKHAIPQGNYLFFEEDCDAWLFLFDSPRVLKMYADIMGIDANKLFESCKNSVNMWHEDYYEDKDYYEAMV